MIVKQALTAAAGLPISPYGEWFEHEVHTGRRRVPVVFFQTGCGKIPAAAAAQYAIQKWQPSLVLNLGTCGGFKGRVEKGDVLLATRTVVYDIHERSGGNDEQLAKYATDLDVSWVGKPYPDGAREAVVATADQDLDPGRIEELSKKHGAVAADWESGAIAFVAHKKNSVRCLILRGVSDVVDPGAGVPSTAEAIREGTRIVMEKLLRALPDWVAKALPAGV
jgi:adenosylhomocysteine nucleosidase